MATSPKNKMMMVSKNTMRSYHLLDTYTEWERTLQPFDLIAFGPRPPRNEGQGGCCLPSAGEMVSQCLIACQSAHTCQQAHWSHVGIAVSGRLIEFAPDPNVWYILESVVSGPINDGVPDAMTGHGSNGVQIRVLRDVVMAQHNKSSIVAVHVMDPYLTELKQKFDTFWGKYNDCKFDFVHCCFAVCYVPCSTCCIPQDAYFFCSEMATMFYQECGWISRDVQPEKVSPEELVEFVGDLKSEANIFRQYAHVFMP